MNALQNRHSTHANTQEYRHKHALGMQQEGEEMGLDYDGEILTIQLVNRTEGIRGNGKTFLDPFL